MKGSKCHSHWAKRKGKRKGKRKQDLQRCHREGEGGGGIVKTTGGSGGADLLAWPVVWCGGGDEDRRNERDRARRVCVWYESEVRFCCRLNKRR